MTITFFVGNGFDISNGLKTTYKEFLKWYLSFDSSDPDVNAFKKNTIEKDLDTWADAEIAFGEVTERFDVESIPKLQKCIDDFSGNLSEYLKAQTNELKIDYINTAKLITAKITNLDKLLRPESGRLLRNLLGSFSDQTWIYNFISFNYTQLIDRAIETIGVEKEEFAAHKDRKGNDQKDLVGEVIHIHGTTDVEMVFGVDNESQISNEVFRNNSTIKKSLIKPVINRRLKTGIMQNTMNCVDNSSIVVIYGMSLGATDATWWGYIANWLKNNQNGQLLIFTHQSEYNQLLARSFLDIEDSVEEKFFSYSNLDERTRESLRSRIHIVINKNLIPVKFQSAEDLVRQAYREHLLREQ